MDEGVSGWLVVALAVPMLATVVWFMSRLFSGRWIDEDVNAVPSDQDLRTDRWTTLQHDRDPLDPP